MRISDWSSDGCSSDLLRLALFARLAEPLVCPLEKILLSAFERPSSELPEFGFQRLPLLLQLSDLLLMRLFSFIARRPQRRGFRARRFPFAHHLAQSALKVGNPLASPFFDFDVLQPIAALLEPLEIGRPEGRESVS